MVRCSRLVIFTSRKVLFCTRRQVFQLYFNFSVVDRATWKQVNKGKRVFLWILYFRTKLETCMTIELRWVKSKEPENTVPFVTWNTRNFKPEYLVKWKAPSVSKSKPARFTSTCIWKINWAINSLSPRLETRTTQLKTLSTRLKTQMTRLKTRYSMLEVKITLRERRPKKTLINNFSIKQRAFYHLNEWYGSNITGDIIFSKRIDLKIRTLHSSNKHFVNDLPTRAETQFCPCKNIKFTC